MSTTAPDQRITTYQPTVATTEFAALFPIFDNDDIAVIHNGEYRTDFTVTATYTDGVSNDARVHFANGLIGKVMIVGERAPRRQNRFGPGPIPARDINLAFDTVEAEVQESSREMRRAHRAPLGEGGGVFSADQIAKAQEYSVVAKNAAEQASSVLDGLVGYNNTGLVAANTWGVDATVSIPLAIEAVGSTKKEIDLGGLSWSLPSPLVNPYGATFKRGKILVPSKIAGKQTQANSYAPDVNGLMVNRENLALFWKLSTLGNSQVRMYGDSTVELNSGYVPGAHGLFKRALWEAGINVAGVFNHGVSGTSWSDLNAIPNLGPNVHLIVIKYGINDASKANALSTLAQDARAKLAAIRAAPYGSFQSLSILLMGPNSTYSPTGNQDAKWYEDLRAIYVQLCKEFDCAYFDTYAYLQETKNAPGFWMDDLSGIGKPGEGLHPDTFAVYWIYYAAIKDHVFGDGCWSTVKSNHFWNLSQYEPGDGSKNPAQYDFGVIWQNASKSAGFPLDGLMMTQRGADGVVVQTIHTVDVVPRTAKRTGISSNFTWTQWTGVPIAFTAFLNGWTNKGGGYASAGYHIGDDGFIELFGSVTGGTLNTALFTLPVGARPAAAHIYVAALGATITIFPDGTVSCASSSNATISLDGIRYRVLNSF